MMFSDVTKPPVHAGILWVHWTCWVGKCHSPLGTTHFNESLSLLTIVSLHWTVISQGPLKPSIRGVT